MLNCKSSAVIFGQLLNFDDDLFKQLCRFFDLPVSFISISESLFK